MPSATKINPDIREERNKVSFDIEEFTNWYYKGAEKVEEKRFLGKLKLQLLAQVFIQISFQQKTSFSPTRSLKTVFQSVI